MTFCPCGDERECTNCGFCPDCHNEERCLEIFNADQMPWNFSKFIRIDKVPCATCNETKEYCACVRKMVCPECVIQERHSPNPVRLKHPEEIQEHLPAGILVCRICALEEVERSIRREQLNDPDRIRYVLARYQCLGYFVDSNGDQQQVDGQLFQPLSILYPGRTFEPGDLDECADCQIPRVHHDRSRASCQAFADPYQRRLDLLNRTNTVTHSWTATNFRNGVKRETFFVFQPDFLPFLPKLRGDGPENAVEPSSVRRTLEYPVQIHFDIPKEDRTELDWSGLEANAD